MQALPADVKTAGSSKCRETSSVLHVAASQVLVLASSGIEGRGSFRFILVSSYCRGYKRPIGCLRGSGPGKPGRIVDAGLLIPEFRNFRRLEPLILLCMRICRRPGPNPTWRLCVRAGISIIHAAAWLPSCNPDSFGPTIPNSPFHHRGGYCIQLRSCINSLPHTSVHQRSSSLFPPIFLATWLCFSLSVLVHCLAADD